MDMYRFFQEISIPAQGPTTLLMFGYWQVFVDGQTNWDLYTIYIITFVKAHNESKYNFVRQQPKPGLGRFVLGFLVTLTHTNKETKQ
jgi:hypothetical protein